MRPLLAADSFIRTYLGEAGRFWVIVRGPGRTRVRIGSELRAILELCDGGRRSAQIAREARSAKQLNANEVERILQPLIREGVVHDLDGPPPRVTRFPPEIGLRLTLLDDETLACLKLVPAPGMGVGCHGKGGCCFLYDRLRLDGAEVARIHQAYGDELTPGGLSVESAVMRERADEDAFGLAVSGGGCVLLQPDGHCGVHHRLGVAAKPGGCRTYPLRDVKCGDELHVGMAVECRCSVDFAREDPSTFQAEAEILLERRKHTRIVEDVADEVSLDQKVSRDDYLRWRAEAGERLSGATDVLDWALHALPKVAPPDEWIDPLRRWLAFEAADLARLYDPGDMQRRLLAWARDASQQLGRPHPAVDGERVAAEQLLFAHGFLRAGSVSIGLTSFALRILLARAGAAIPLPAELLPIVSVEYLGRVYSLGHIFD